MSTLLAIGFPGPFEMVIILFVMLLLFGSAKLPSLMRNMGKSANEFQKGLRESSDALNGIDETDDGEKPDGEK